jgi:hypothetical protein
MPVVASRTQTMSLIRRHPRAAQRVRIATAAHMIQRISHGTPEQRIISRKNMSDNVSLPSAPSFGFASRISSSWMIAASECRP